MTTILVVDDDQDTADLFVYLLQTKGYTALCANSLKEALNMCTAHIDLLITDLFLGDGLGSELLTRLMYLPVTILITGGDDFPSMRYPGFDDYLVKPVDINLFLETVQSCLDLREAA